MVIVVLVLPASIHILFSGQKHREYPTIAEVSGEGDQNNVTLLDNVTMAEKFVGLGMVENDTELERLLYIPPFHDRTAIVQERPTGKLENVAFLVGTVIF